MEVNNFQLQDNACLNDDTACNL